jgi:hypothetical protein
MNIVKSKLLLIPCQLCGKIFPKKHIRHQFCQRKCFLIYQRQKHKEFPLYRCEFCRSLITLDFFPRKTLEKWGHFVCPKCQKKQSEAVTHALQPRTSFDGL